MLLRFIVILLIPFFLGHAPKSAKASSKKPCRPSLARAFITGNSKCLPKKTYLKMKDMNLLHLTTLSGIHLSILISILCFRSSFKIPLLLCLLCISQLFSGYFAIKRMLVMKILMNKFSINTSFLLVFIFDYLIGSFSNSPLSYIYSFGFLTTVITSKATNNLILCLEMLFMQAFIAHFMHESILPLSFLVNFFLIPIFAIVFPSFFIPGLNNYSSGFFEVLIDANYQMISIIPKVQIPLICLIALSFLYLRIKSKIAIVLILLGTSLKLDNIRLKINYQAVEIKRPLI
jgi:predicted membrane metal-binding protein